MARTAPARRLTQQLDEAQREFVRLAQDWLAQPATVEPLHDLRVASRRLRAVLDLLRRESSLEPSATAAKEALKPLLQSSSAVRDLDVLLPQLRQWAEESPELLPLGAVITAQRDELAAEFGALWRSQQLLMAGALQTLRQQLKAAQLQRDFYQAGLERCEKRVRRAARLCADNADAPSWHRLRVRCKQWRYTLDLVSSKPRRRLRNLQRSLGDAQDAAAAMLLLTQLAAPTLSPACLLAMGRQQGRLERQRIDALDDAGRQLGRLLDK